MSSRSLLMLDNRLMLIVITVEFVVQVIRVFAFGMTENVIECTSCCEIFIGISAFLPTPENFLKFCIATCNSSLHHQVCLSLRLLLGFVRPRRWAALLCTYSSNCRYRNSSGMNTVIADSSIFGRLVAHSLASPFDSSADNYFVMPS